MKTKMLLIVITAFTLSCSTMRLQVKSPYKSAQGNGVLIYERSYDVGGGMPLWCGLTAIFYGGACWAYLGMPFVPQEEKAVKDATTTVNEKLGSADAVLERPEVTRLSWTSAETYVSLEEEKKTTEP